MSQSENQFERLMEQIRIGSPEAATQLYREYVSHVIRVVRRRLHPSMRRRLDSADMLQAVWASFFAIPANEFTFHTPKQLIDFRCRIAQNKVVDEARRMLGTQKRRLARENYLEDMDSGAPLPDPRQHTASKAAMADDCWEQLLRDQPALIRDMLALRRLGFTPTEIAARLGVHPKTIRRYLQRLAKELPS
jgi:RNA polymerase sigma factor (sigma-70 family)